MREAANAARFAEIFRDSPRIRIPAVIDGYTARRVLVLEWIDGIKVNDYAALERADVDRSDVARQTVEAYFHQFFEVGFFHADPHPGNIFVQPGPSPTQATVAFVDFGMVGALNRIKQGLAGPVPRIRREPACDGAGAVSTRLHRRGRQPECHRTRGGGHDGAVPRHDARRGARSRLPRRGIRTRGSALQPALPRPCRLAFTGKAVGTLAGVATGLAPDLNLIDVAAPYARRFRTSLGDGAGQTAQQVLDQLTQSGRSLVTLPGRLERALTRLESGQIEIRIADGPPDGRAGRLDGPGAPRAPSSSPALGGASWALMVAAALAGGGAAAEPAPRSRLVLPRPGPLTLLLLALRRGPPTAPTGSAAAKDAGRCPPTTAGTSSGPRRSPGRPPSSSRTRRAPGRPGRCRPGGGRPGR